SGLVVRAAPAVVTHATSAPARQAAPASGHVPATSAPAREQQPSPAADPPARPTAPRRLAPVAEAHPVARLRAPAEPPTAFRPPATSSSGITASAATRPSS